MSWGAAFSKSVMLMIERKLSFLFLGGRPTSFVSGVNEAGTLTRGGGPETEPIFCLHKSQPGHGDGGQIHILWLNVLLKCITWMNWFESFRCLLPSIFQQDFRPSGMRVQKAGQVVGSSFYNYPAALSRDMLSNFSSGTPRQCIVKRGSARGTCGTFAEELRT